MNPAKKNDRLNRLRQILLNEAGQMSVFIALIFQVLFVFFAMVVNIGMVVHDKINLQNAVDLGAFYGAQRQAEILNEIAHVNYQIRQDYKLLAWRYRVIGTLGRQKIGATTEADFPPARSINLALDDVPWNPATAYYGAPPNQKEIPSVCVANNLWGELAKKSPLTENYCFRPYGSATPLVSIVKPFPIPGLSAITSALTASSISARQTQVSSCADAGVLNWRYTMMMMYAYRLAIASRKTLLMEMRRNLVSDNFKDRQANPVRDGVLKTVKKNLTSTNLAQFDDSYFQVVNGLNSEKCAGPNGDGEPTIPEIQTSPMLFYVASGDPTNPVNACTIYQSAYDVMTYLDINQVQANDQSGILRAFTQEPPPNDPFHASLGFEKNPWCVAYVGVHAKSAPRKPFAPLGKEVVLEARAFAQPFGGRVGPWYESRWPQNSPTSSGGDRVDPLTSPRQINGVFKNNATDIDRLPNFSRYPGDSLGLESQIALGAQRKILSSYTSPTAALGAKLQLDFFNSLSGYMSTGDALAWDWDPVQQAPTPNETDRVKALRAAEVAAVTPDLFDAIYYSIDPAYYQNYLSYTQAAPRFPQRTLLGAQVAAPPDIGGRNGVADLAQYDVSLQIQSSVGDGSGSSASTGIDGALLTGNLGYVIRKWEHLLTGWGSEKAQTFTFPESRFAKCEHAAPASIMIPGKCATGGRVGYSVRILSRDYLLSPKWAVGGDGEAAGPINNPPDPGF